jgi:hypothetical protein
VTARKRFRMGLTASRSQNMQDGLGLEWSEHGDGTTGYDAYGYRRDRERHVASARRML